MAAAGGAAALSSHAAAVASLSAALAPLSSAVPDAQAALGGGAFGSWSLVDGDEAIALDIPFDTYATKETFYSTAVVSALAYCLNASAAAVSFSAFGPTAGGAGTAVYFNVLLAGTDSSTAVPASVVAVASLFASNAVGAPALPPLLAALQRFGLPVSAAHYEAAAFPPPPSPSPPPPPLPPPSSPPSSFPFPPPVRGTVEVVCSAQN